MGKKRRLALSGTFSAENASRGGGRMKTGAAAARGGGEGGFPLRKPSSLRQRTDPSGSPPSRSAEADDGGESSSFPIRNTDRLHAAVETVDCAMNRGCVPCAYKIGCFDVALDREFCGVVPNQRPEMCPRSGGGSGTDRNRADDDGGGVLGFRRGMSILTVGDGDFTFSLGLARRLLPKRDATGDRDAHRTFLVATSYESESTLRRVYPDFDRTLRELTDRGAHVAYEVDATRILETLSLPDEAEAARRVVVESGGGFHRICWNFPCTAIGGGQDGQNKAMEENKELVRGFVRSARSALTRGGDGELCVCHKTKPPFNQWNLEEVALQKQEQQRGGGRHPTEPRLLHYSGRIVLDRYLLSPYTPRKALDKKSFPCHDACFYIFAQRKPAREETRTSSSLFAPTIPPRAKEREVTGDGGDDTREGTAAMLTEIEPELIKLLRRKRMNDAKPKRKKKKRKGTREGKRAF